MWSTITSRLFGGGGGATEEPQKLSTQPRLRKVSPQERSYFKQVRWSPDGQCILTNSADAAIRLYPLLTSDTTEMWEAGTVLKNAETVHDVVWYPFMSTENPSTCCFFVASREHPIHLRDAYTLANRASYTYVDHREKMVSPYALAVNSDASKLVGTCDASIVLFDVHRPGNDCTVIKTSPKRKSREGQKSVLSCIDFAPNAEALYAVGAYDKSIWLYEAKANKRLLKLGGKQKSGVTQVKFSDDGLHLFSANRNDTVISIWDIRQSAKCVAQLPRPGKTNQRLQFDAKGDLIVSGDTDGYILLYDWKRQDPLVATWQAHHGTSFLLSKRFVNLLTDEYRRCQQYKFASQRCVADCFC